MYFVDTHGRRKTFADVPHQPQNKHNKLGLEGHVMCRMFTMSVCVLFVFIHGQRVFVMCAYACANVRARVQVMCVADDVQYVYDCARSVNEYPCVTSHTT